MQMHYRLCKLRSTLNINKGKSQGFYYAMIFIICVYGWIRVRFLGVSPTMFKCAIAVLAVSVTSLLYRVSADGMHLKVKLSVSFSKDFQLVSTKAA